LTTLKPEFRLLHCRLDLSWAAIDSDASLGSDWEPIVDAALKKIEQPMAITTLERMRAAAKKED